jgi:WD40 repeat protein
VLFTRWVPPTNPMAAKSEYHFLTGGADGVNFWTLQGSTMTKKQGRFSKKFKSAPLLCAANLQGKDTWRVVVGTAAGDLYAYDEREVSDAAEGAHKGPVLCVAEGGEDCQFLVSGGRDHVIKLWNQALQPISVFDVTPFSCVDASVASIDVRPVDSHNPGLLTLLVGTYGGEIIEVSSSSKGGGVAKKAIEGGPGADPRTLELSHASASVLLHSHYSGELWGLAVHPLDPDLYATVGDDRTLRIWSIKRNCLLKAQPLYWPARSVAWHPSGAALAVGFHEATKGGAKAGKGKKGAAGECVDFVCVRQLSCCDVWYHGTSRRSALYVFGCGRFGPFDVTRTRLQCR